MYGFSSPKMVLKTAASDRGPPRASFLQAGIGRRSQGILRSWRQCLLQNIMGPKFIRALRPAPWRAYLTDDPASGSLDKCGFISRSMLQG